MTPHQPTAPPSHQAADRVRLYSTLRHCDQAVIRSQSEQSLFEQVCQDLVGWDAFLTVWVGMLNPATQALEPLACAGLGCGPLPELTPAGGPPHPALQALASNEAQWGHPHQDQQPAQAAADGPCAAALPLQRQNQAVGVLCVLANSPDAFDADVRALLRQMASNISYALDNMAHRRQLEQAEAQARQAQRLTQAFIDQLPGTVFLKDANLRLLMVNRHLAQALGAEARDLIGRNNDQIFPPEFAAAANALDRTVLDSGTHQTVAQTFHAQHLETRLFVVDDDNGQHLLGGISLDVTDQHNDNERTQSLLALQEVAVDLDERALLTQGLEMVERLTHSQIGFLHFVNPDQETLELVTWTGGALRGCTAAYDNHYPISSAGVWADCFRQRAPVVVNDYATLPHKHGLPAGHTPLQRFVSVPIIEVGRVCMMLGVGNKTVDYTQSDVETLQLIGNDLWRMTRRSRAEQALQQRLHELEAVNAKLADMQLHLLQTEKMASIGQLAAGVAHEINNPIGFVRSNLSTLKRYAADLIGVVGRYEAAEEALGSAHSDAFTSVNTLKAETDIAYTLSELPCLLDESLEGIERVRKIVQDLKNFSRSGDTDFQWADLTQGLESTINIVWNQIKYKAELRREYQPLPQVHCVASQINQVLMNLLVNAAQAIDQQGVITVRTGADAQEVWIEVEDTGCGMTGEQMKRIFEPFFTTKPPGQGTGLGLAIAWRVMERHHGHIDIQSEPGRGSRFRVRLPIDGRQSAAEPTPTPT
jgi:PAS domain S-box-containing protein